MDEKVRVLFQIEIPNLDEDINTSSIRKELNDYIKGFIPQINIVDLGDWNLLILINIRSTNGIGVFKRARRYPSDKEFEFCISLTIPNEDEAIYGLSKVKDGFYFPLNEKNFYLLEPNFKNYSNLYEYVLDSSKRAIDLAFNQGFTCNGKRIKKTK